ncbi:MAG: hydroxypyruvate isomerase [Desulfitibacter sp. BRH_c19]|nr:MAG: hydroxypyruvate isomerase [Desulfitibacter sp. BRH_c19]
MLRFTANLTFLFTELPFMERFGAARKAGFNYVEFMFPYDFNLDEIEKQLKQHSLKLVLFNLSAGNWEEGDRGIAFNPERKSEFRGGVEKGIAAAQKFGVNRVNCLVGKVDEQSSNSSIWENLVENICYAADEFAKYDINLMVEPINHYDIPGFYLNTTDAVLKLISEVNRPNVYLQYDIYHAERETENHKSILNNYFDKIGHIQIADNPGRHQPGTGDIDFTFLFDEIERLGYNGYIGLEYKPEPNTFESLGWVKEYGYKL